MAVVHGRWDARDIIDALLDALEDQPEPRELLRAARNKLTEQTDPNGSVFADLLNDLLSGPCSQADQRGRPLLLVIDDLEQLLDRDNGRPPTGYKRPLPILWRHCCGPSTQPVATAACC